MGFHILILAGGSGTRLWPLSRRRLPKHLLPLGPDGQSLLAATVERVLPIADAVHVVTAAAQADLCWAALGGVATTAVDVITEPSARGTGPALGLAVHRVARDDPGAAMASVHADAHVGDPDAYRAALLAAAGWAWSTDGLALVGLRPRSPATGLGYIEVGTAEPAGALRLPASPAPESVRTAAAALPAAHAAAFVEKPDAERARDFLAGGRHLWNPGLFAWTAPSFLRELRAADGELDDRLAAVAAAQADGRDAEAAATYNDLAAVAVEPLVFERTARLTVVRADFPWSDLGSWADLLETRAGEAADGNLVAGDSLLIGSSGCLVDARAGRTVAVVGAEGLVVVDTGDAVLVMPAAASQRVREVVDSLRARGREDLL